MTEKYDSIIVDTSGREVDKLRDSLEDMEFYLIEIEAILDQLDTNPDEETKIHCQLRLAGIQHRIAEIGRCIQLKPVVRILN